MKGERLICSVSVWRLALDSTDPLTNTACRPASSLITTDVFLLSPAGPVKTEVPQRMVHLLGRVIDGRQQSARWYAARRDSSAKSNDSHQHFVNTLQSVWSILDPLVSTVNTVVAGHSNTATREISASSMHNPFSGLEVQEPSGIECEAQAYPDTEDLTPDDSTFALWCHIKDLQDCRETAKQRLLDYAAGNITLQSALVFVETAQRLMRISSEVFEQDYPAFSNWWDLPRLFSFEAVSDHKITYIHVQGTSLSDGSFDEELIASLCPATACLLKEIIGKIGECAQTAKGQRILTSKFLPDAMMIRLPQYYYDFGTVFRMQAQELLHWVSQVKKHGKPTKTDPRRGFYNGVAEYYLSGHLPIWLVVACEMHVDMYEAIGDQPGCVNDAYLDFDSSLQAKMRGVKAYASQSTACDGFVRSFEACAKSLSDEYRNNLMDLGPTTFRTDVSTWDAPCVMGNALTRIQLSSHTTGLELANNSAMVLSMATLYSALKKLGLLSATWQDMEFVIGQQKGDDPFVAKAGKNPDAKSLLQQFVVALGTPACRSSLERTSNPPESAQVAVNHRRLQVTFDFWASMIDAFVVANVVGPAKEDWIEEALRRLMTDATEETSPGSSKKSKKRSKRKLSTHAELLTSFKEAFVKDEPHINFDYLGFWVVCARLSEELYRVSASKLSPRVKDRVEPWKLVFHLLQSATGSAERSLLPDAATAMTKMTEDPGASNKFSKQALHASSGHQPKTDRPKPYNPAFTAELWQKFSENSIAMKATPVKLLSANASQLTVYGAPKSKAELKKLFNTAAPFWEMWGRTVLLAVGVQHSKEEGQRSAYREDGIRVPLYTIGRRRSESLRARGLSMINWDQLVNVDHAPGTALPPTKYHLADMQE